MLIATAGGYVCFQVAHEHMFICIQIGAFQDINVDKDRTRHSLLSPDASTDTFTDSLPKFATLDIVLGSLYMATCVIELFGVIAAVMVRHTADTIWPLLTSGQASPLAHPHIRMAVCA